jgi:hypothetical protein
MRLVTLKKGTMAEGKEREHEGWIEQNSACMNMSRSEGASRYTSFFTNTTSFP